MFKNVIQFFMGKRNPFKKWEGEMVFIRCITFYYNGRVISVDGNLMTLSDASWIADTGRLTQALATETFREVELFPGPVTINTDLIVDIIPFGSVQMEQKP